MRIRPTRASANGRPASGTIFTHRYNQWPLKKTKKKKKRTSQTLLMFASLKRAVLENADLLSAMVNTLQEVSNSPQINTQ